MNQHQCNPEQIYMRKQRAKIRDRWKCAACSWRPTEMGGGGTCATKYQYLDGGRCGFSHDADFEVPG